MTANKELVDKTVLSQAVLAATTDMFKMFSVCVVGGQVPPGETPTLAPGYCAVVRFTREVNGQVAVTLSSPVAKALAASVYGPDEAGTDQRMKEVVAEVANMIAGGIRNNLQAVGLDFDISLPEGMSPSASREAMGAEGVSLSFHVNNDGCIVDTFICQASEA
jgi:CheY-specific phosphatase CheX